MVMGYEEVVTGRGKKRIYKKVPFQPALDARSFICGLCVVYGYLKPEIKQPDDKHFDLKEWRKGKGLTQVALALKLGIGRSMISKVESGEKVMPSRWAKMLSKLRM
jgi:DNA-binding XRE family transcriptional regulator